MGSQMDHTADNWELRCHHNPELQLQRFDHYKLVDIYGPAPYANWPSGSDCLLLTQCLQFARSRPYLDLDTSHFAWIIQTQGLQETVVPRGFNHDIDARSRLDIPDPAS